MRRRDWHWTWALPEVVVGWLGALLCVRGRCNITCRGRVDHYGVRPGNRYVRWLG